MYLAPVIDETLESIRSKIVGKSSYFYITSVLNRAFKNTERFKFRYETFENYSKDDYSVSGLYDMDKNQRHIIINFPKCSGKIEITPKMWRDFKFSISQVCQHETIHQDQWQYRESDGEPCMIDFRRLSETDIDEKEYLADSDEIDAYAHDIAMEIKFCYGRQDPLEVLRNIDSKRKLWSYNYYKKTFKGDDWTIIKKRLLKKTFLWLPHVTIN